MVIVDIEIEGFKYGGTMKVLEHARDCSRILVSVQV